MLSPLPLLSLAVITLIGVGIRLLTQVTIQQRRERMNRQINERLRALMAAYKTLGGSFTGDLTVDPTHRRDLRRHAEASAGTSTEPLDLSVADSHRHGPGTPGSGMRSRRPCPTSSCSVQRNRSGWQRVPRTSLLPASSSIPTNWSLSLRAFIREALDLDPHPG